MCGNMALILAFTALSACGTAPMSSPDDLAIYTRCDVDNIAHWVGQRVDYKEQGPVWDSAGVCMARGWGDCKCAAAVAEAEVPPGIMVVAGMVQVEEPELLSFGIKS